MSFDTFGLHDALLRGVKELGFTEPSPIQRQSLVPGLAGKDVLACAATGSGKTAAFVLPVLNRLADRPRGTTRALVITPTRELAQQIDDHAKSLGKYLKVKSAAVYGGVAMGPQRFALQRGADIVVATPGRLLDHMRQNNAKLKQVEMLVLDEADRMLDMGFLPDIRRILGALPKERQTFLFSATMPREMERLTRDIQRSPVTIDIKRQGQPAQNIAQHVLLVPDSKKAALLLALARSGDIRTALVFTRTKRRADRVAKILSRNGVGAERIHGDRTQAQRTRALEDFKRERFNFLIATDVAARGIDVQDLSHVINYDMPGTTDDYIHRIGRTARAKASGDALTFVTPEDRGALKAVERRLKKRIEVQGLPDLSDLNIQGTVEPTRRQNSYGSNRRDASARAAQPRHGGRAHESSWASKKKRPHRRTEGSQQQASQESASNGNRFQQRKRNNRAASGHNQARPAGARSRSR